jgi:hypothetical protein
VVDHADWELPKRIPLTGIEVESIAGWHVEADTITGLASRTLTVTFNTAFTSAPTGWVKVYRMTEMPDGGYREQDVLWGYATSTKVTTTGFSIIINEDESLTGVIVEYDFK